MLLKISVLLKEQPGAQRQGTKERNMAVSVSHFKLMDEYVLVVQHRKLWVKLKFEGEENPYVDQQCCVI